MIVSNDLTSIQTHQIPLIDAFIGVTDFKRLPYVIIPAQRPTPAVIFKDTFLLDPSDVETPQTMVYIHRRTPVDVFVGIICRSILSHAYTKQKRDAAKQLGDLSWEDDDGKLQDDRDPNAKDPAESVCDR